MKILLCTGIIFNFRKINSNFWAVPKHYEKIWENFAKIIRQVNEILVKIWVTIDKQILSLSYKLAGKLAEKLGTKQYKLLKIWDLLMIR